MKQRLTLFFAFLLAGVTLCPAYAQAPDAPLEATLVKAAITRLLSKPIVKPSDDLSLVVNYAQKSDAVRVELVPGLANIGKTTQDALLMGYFIAGAVQFDIDHPKEATDPVADKMSAVKAALFEYRALQKQNKTFKRPEMDIQAALEKKGKLLPYIRAAVQKSASKR